MDTKALERHFGDRDRAMDAIGIYRQIWEYWQNNGIPIGRQYQIQVLTGGALKAGDELRKRSRA